MTPYSSHSKPLTSNSEGHCRNRQSPQQNPWTRYRKNLHLPPLSTPQNDANTSNNNASTAITDIVIRVVTTSIITTNKKTNCKQQVHQDYQQQEQRKTENWLTISNAAPRRIALWNTHGVKFLSSQVLVHDFLTSLKIDVAALANTNLPTSQNPPWKSYPNSCWTTTIQLEEPKPLCCASIHNLCTS
jgi:hypothetical protein